MATQPYPSTQYYPGEITIDDKTYKATFAIWGDADLSDATATPGDILAGKTAYTAQGKITGTLLDISYWQTFN